MELQYEKDRFVLYDCTYDNRMIPKNAKFRWNPEIKKWWTDDVKKASSLTQFADAACKDQLEKVKKEQKEKIESSKAVNSNINIPVPKDLVYMPFQKAGIAYATDKENVLIGDEMGLGKTIQAIGLINLNPETKRVLVICPASLKINWKNELEKWLVNNYSIGIANKSFPNSNIIIVNYDIVKKYQKELREVDWDIMVIDECHYLKNYKVQRTGFVLGKWNKDPEKIITPIPAKKKVFLTGTPIVNRPIELFPILNSVGLFRSWKYYVTRYCAGKQTRYGWDVSGSSNSLELQEKLRTEFMVRRLKKDVLKELPAKVRQIITLPQNGFSSIVKKEQKAWKEQEEKLVQLKAAVELTKCGEDKDEYKKAVEALSEGSRIAFTEMSKLRHLTALSKVPLVIDHLKEVIETGKKVIVFGHHKDVIKAIQSEFIDNSVVLVGDTKIEDRQKAVEEFQNNSNIKLFIGSIKAAGIGITLTASSHVVFAELDWVPGNITQAEDRAHRIGQENSVFIQHLILDGSIDADMAKVLIDKQKVLDKVLDDEIVNEPIVPIDYKPKSKSAIKNEAEKITESDIELITKMLRSIAFSCDGAKLEDGQGFNKIDTYIGKSLAQNDILTPKQAILAKHICRKYKRQIPEDIYSKIY